MSHCISGAIMFSLTLLAWAGKPAPSRAEPIPPKIVDSWKRYERFADSISGSATTKEFFESSVTKQEGDVKTLEVKQAKGCKRLQFTEKGEEHALVSNPKYAFEVSRNAIRSEWYANQVFAGDNKPAEKFTFSLEHELPGMCCAPAMALDMPLATLFSAADIRILEQGEITEDGKKVYRIRFDRTSMAAPVGSRIHIQSGTVDLDVSRSYLVRKATWNVSRGNEQSFIFNIDIDYGDSVGETPLPRHLLAVENTYYLDKHLVKSTTSVNLSLTANRSFSDDEFSLRGFGLPEPEGLEYRTRTNLRWWLIGGSLACLLAGFALSQYLRRNRPLAPTASA